MLLTLIEDSQLFLLSNKYIIWHVYIVSMAMVSWLVMSFGTYTIWHQPMRTGFDG